MINREYLDHVAFFNGCGEKFLDTVSVLLSEVQVDSRIRLKSLNIDFSHGFQFAPEEWIYRAGEMANEMYFVASGLVEELGERDKVLVIIWTLDNQYHFES
jgi:CRP-like cAMP-binding protein